jgi:hypothetical protein
MNTEYIVTKCFDDPDQCDVYAQRMLDFVKQDKLIVDDETVEGSKYTYGTFDDLLQEKCEYFSDIVGKKLFPTFSSARLYGKGQYMTYHVDQTACEYAVSTNLGYKGDNLYPFYLGDDAHEVLLDKNECVIYKGMEVPHWREYWDCKEDDWLVQLFMFYVDAEGPYKEHAYHKRNKLGEDSGPIWY